MNTFDKYLLGAVISGIFAAIFAFVCGLDLWLGSCYGKKMYDQSAEIVFIILDISLWVLAIVCIVECVKHRKDPNPIAGLPLAKTEGFHMSGLPCAGTPNVELKLYRDKILFEIWLNHMGTKKQTVSLDISKVTSIQKIANVLQTSAVSQNTSTTINSSDYPHDNLAINYTSEGEDKQILISLPTLTNAGKFVKQYEKINPSNNQPIEL